MGKQFTKEGHKIKQITLRVPEPVIWTLTRLYNAGGPRGADDPTTVRTFTAKFLESSAKAAEIQLNILKEAWEEEKEELGY